MCVISSQSALPMMLVTLLKLSCEFLTRGNSGRGMFSVFDFGTCHLCPILGHPGLNIGSDTLHYTTPGTFKLPALESCYERNNE